VKFLWDGFKQAIHLLLHPSPDLLNLIRVTLEVALVAAVVAMLLGVPVGLWLGLGRFHGRGLLLSLANAGLGLPPVVVGLVLSLLMFRGAPLGSLHLIYTVKGVILAQVVLALPVVIAITTAAIQEIDPALLRQAQALGASRWGVRGFALREARIGVFTAGMAAVGAGLSEVGAVVLVGGNVQGQTSTLATSLLVSVSAGEYAQAMAVGLILLGLILLLGAGLTIAQQRQPRARSVRGLSVGRR
jgi:tungstate transport system permease protein